MGKIECENNGGCGSYCGSFRVRDTRLVHLLVWEISATLSMSHDCKAVVIPMVRSKETALAIVMGALAPATRRRLRAIESVAADLIERRPHTWT